MVTKKQAGGNMASISIEEMEVERDLQRMRVAIWALLVGFVSLSVSLILTQTQFVSELMRIRF